MSHVRQALSISLAVFLSFIATAGSRAAESPTPTTPWTQEKVKPAEVQDKEKKKEEPIATCEKKEKKTGEKYHEVSYQDGTVVRYYPGNKWVITIPGPKGKTKITYDNDKKSRTVEEPGKPPVVQDPAKDQAAKDWKEGKEKEAKESAPGRRGSLRSPFVPDWLVNAAYRVFEPNSSASAPGEAAPGKNIASSPAPLILAATVERPSTPAPQTQGRPSTINIKIVTYGNPPTGTTIYIDPGPPTTPERFTENPHPSWWDGWTDPEHPWTYPGPTGQPVQPGQPTRPGKPGQPGQPGQPTPGPGTTPIPGPDEWPTPGPGGGWIHVGWGWASGRIPQTVAGSCAGVDTDDLPQTQSGGGATPQTTEKEDFKGFFGAERRTPQTMVRDCSELLAKINYLLSLLKAIHDNNMKHAKAASDAFWGDPKSEYYGGYAHWFSQAKITEAVVDANNATGKFLIDTALFAMGGWGGFGGKFGETADVLFGSGIRGAKSVGEVYYKIAQKVIGKIADEAIGGKAGTMGTAAWKTAEKINWEGKSVEPEKLLQGSMSGLESVLRGSIIDGIGNWMKEGAMSGDLQRAKDAYTEFLTNANLANLDAAEGDQVKQELEDLIAEAKAQNCPTPPVPDYSFYTFDLQPFGQGMFQGQKGPVMRFGPLGGSGRQWDMFGRTSSPM